jgi:acetylornithine/N-succinyldiaminopimelate aminotransferase
MEAILEAPAPAPVLTAAQQVIELEKQYVLQNYGRYPLVLDRGKGCYLYDLDGKKYLDLISGIGVNALGHAHPRILKVIREQSAKLIHTSNLYFHPYQGQLAKKLCETSGLQRAFFCNSGTEAVEGAIKMCKSHGRRISPEKFEIISLDDSFHGRTVGALSLTGQPKYRQDFEPLMPGVRFVPRNDEAALEAAFSERTCGIFIEGIQGEGGINAISTSFLRKARELADRYDALLVCDEIQSGVGRPGVHYSYFLHTPAILPDIMVAAKPVACGLPMGFAVTNERAAASISPGMHGTTFGGGALACRVALEFYEMLDELMPQMNRVGEYFREQLRGLAGKYKFIKDVRGAGLMIGVELDRPGKQMVLDGMSHGLLFNCTHDTVLRFLPPYILTEKEVDIAIRGLKKVFTQAKRTKL